MKLLLTVLLFLFTYLTGSAVHADHTYVNSRRHCALATEKANRALTVSSKAREFHLDKIYNLNQDSPDFLLLEEEDDGSIIKTHIRKYYAFFSDVFFPVHYTSPNASLTVCRDLSCTDSCKYIAQRVLRI